MVTIPMVEIFATKTRKHEKEIPVGFRAFVFLWLERRSRSVRREELALRALRLNVVS
jgi:hypothetical protein